MPNLARPAAKHAMAVTISEQVKQLGLETHVLELEVDRLIVVPPEVHGIAMDRFDNLVELLLAKSERMIGCLSRPTAGRLRLRTHPGPALRPDPDAAGASRVVEIDPRSNEIVWTFRGKPAYQFLSGHISGALQPATPNVLVCQGTSRRFPDHAGSDYDT